MRDGEELIAAYNDFEAMAGVYNNLTNKELADLAVMLGVKDGAAAQSVVEGDMGLVDIILQIGDAYYAYTENPNKDTAAGFVYMYEEVFAAAGVAAAALRRRAQ